MSSSWLSTLMLAELLEGDPFKVLLTLPLDPLSYSLKSLQEEIQLPDDRNDEPSSLNSDEHDPFEFCLLMRIGFGGFR